MAINRYRLRHQARQKKGTALLILGLLKRPDRLLGLILTGNCVSNILASSIVTFMAMSWGGEQAVFLYTVVLILVVLVFAEVAPKTVAALYPEGVARWVAWPVLILMKGFYPLVWLTNVLSNGLLRLFRVRVSAAGRQDALTREELRSLVRETGGRISRSWQEMLLGILDLNRITVNDVMVPSYTIVGIDLEWDEKQIQQALVQCSHSWLPVYRGHMNQLEGMLQVRDLMPAVLSPGMHSCRPEYLLSLLKEPYFIPENTPLNIQLLNFRRHAYHVALVADEYGDILGLLTLTDILQEIVGEFVTNLTGTTRLAQQQEDGSWLVEGGLPVREFNRLSGWELPVRGPRTLGGLVIETLEAIPRAGTSVLVRQYPVEVIQVQKNRIRVIRIFPRLKPLTGVGKS